MFQQLSFFIIELHTQQPLVWFILIAVLGMLAGSFITMMCYRLPIILEWVEFSAKQDNVSKLEASATTTSLMPSHNSLSLATPRSFCPHCQKQLSWWHNIPLLSYVLLRGKCYFCQHSIAASYFYVELSCVLLSVITAFFIQHPIHSLWWLLFVWLALALVVLDCRYLLLPDNLNYALLWSGLLFSLVNQTAATAIISACVGYGSFAIINTLYKWIRKRDGIGQGDFKLLAGISVWLSWYELPAVVLLSSVLGLVYALMIFIKGRKVDMSLTVPFAPFLLIAAWLWLIYLNVVQSF